MSKERPLRNQTQSADPSSSKPKSEGGSPSSARPDGAAVPAASAGGGGTSATVHEPTTVAASTPTGDATVSAGTASTSGADEATKAADSAGSGIAVVGVGPGPEPEQPPASALPALAVRQSDGTYRSATASDLAFVTAIAQASSHPQPAGAAAAPIPGNPAAPTVRRNYSVQLPKPGISDANWTKLKLLTEALQKSAELAALGQQAYDLRAPIEKIEVEFATETPRIVAVNIWCTGQQNQMFKIDLRTDEEKLRHEREELEEWRGQRGLR